LLAFLLVAGGVVPLAVHRLSASAARQTLALRVELHSGLVDGIQGAADLAMLNRADTQRDETLLLRSSIDAAQERLAALRGASNALTAFIVAVATFGVLWLSIPLVTSGGIDGVYLALLALVSIAAFEVVQPLTLAVQHLEAGKAAGRRIFDLIDSLPAVVESQAPLPAPCEFDLELRDVSFRYDPEGSLVLKDVSFSLPAGSRLAITGASGCGKSTLVNLLLRFWDREGGSVTLGGQDVRDYGLEMLRSCFGVVPQDVYLFNASVRDNLLLANPDATDEQLVAACEQALLHDVVRRLPLGYDTPVGENGQLFSGGERQRLAIARVILKDAPIIILDEPTANLDPDTERRLMSSLEPFLAGRSVLIISHRRAVLETADRVLVMQGGRLTSRLPTAAPLPAGGGRS
jgi:ATP-binding cassette subfamily C protein CydC